MPDTVEADVIVLGAGAAGLAAAVGAARRAPEARVVVVSSGRPGRSGCSPQVQGLNAAVGSADSPEAHFEDIVRRGCFLNDQELAWIVASEAPRVVADLLEGLGCGFARNADGSYEQRSFGLQSHPRKLHAGYDTGRVVLDALRRALDGQQTEVLHPLRGLDIVFDDDGELAGLLVVDTTRGRRILVSAPALVVATGGAPTVFQRTSAREKAGDGVALCVRAGAECRDMEMMQFLSVGLLDPALDPDAPLPLLEESFRLAGAHLLNCDGERFLLGDGTGMGEAAGLESVVRGCWSEIAAGRQYPGGGVGMDLRHLPLDELAAHADVPFDRIRRSGWNPAVDVLEVCPVAHYQVGGLLIDQDGRTGVTGLFAAGEDAGGVHGAAWTGGNGIAEALVLGSRAGRAAVDVWAARSGRRRRPCLPESLPATTEDPVAATRTLRQLMWRFAGPVRSSDGLEEARRRLEHLAAGSSPMVPSGAVGTSEQLDLRSLLVVAHLLLDSALERVDSLGVHWRTDAAVVDVGTASEFVVTRLADGAVAVDRRPVRFDRLEPPSAGRSAS